MLSDERDGIPFITERISSAESFEPWHLSLAPIPPSTNLLAKKEVFVFTAEYFKRVT